jgi:3-oxoacyl-[acyl-carrier-protein] synthase-3
MRCGWTIAGTGSYLPQRVVSNRDLVDIFGLDTDNDWIVQRTGIQQRHIVSDGETTSQMAIVASQRALNAANINANDIDLIVLATTSPDDTFPSVASIVQNSLGCRTIPAFDLQGVCSGFLYALITADAWMQGSLIKNVLVIGAETMSAIINWQDRRTAVLFGDGAGAVVLRADSNIKSGLLSHAMHCDGSLRDILKTDGGPSSSRSLGKIMMTGQEVFRHAVQKLSSSCLQAMEQVGLTINDIDKIRTDGREPARAALCLF